MNEQGRGVYRQKLEQTPHHPIDQPRRGETEPSERISLDNEIEQEPPDIVPETFDGCDGLGGSDEDELDDLEREAYGYCVVPVCLVVRVS